MEYSVNNLAPWENSRYCVVCGNPNVQYHHIFHGSHRRQFADKYKYIIPLCFDHHIGANGIHQAKNRKYDLFWKQKAQRHYEQYYGSRDDFIRECGRSYL